MILRDSTRALQDRLDELRTKANIESTTLADAMELLTIERERAMDKAVDLARAFARVDLDGASQLYREAYERFRTGDIEGTLTVLSSDRLDADYRSATTEKAKGLAAIESADRSIRQLFESYRLRSNVLQSKLAYTDAWATMKSMEVLLREQADAFAPDVRPAFLNDRAILEQMLGEYDAALADLRSAIELSNANGTGDSPAVALSHRNLAGLHRERGEYEEARNEAEIALTMSERLLGDEHQDVGMDHFTLGQAYRELGEADSAKHHLLRAHAILGTNNTGTELQVGALLTSLSSVYYATSELDSAAIVGQQGLDRMKAAAAPGHPDLVASYNNLSVVVADQGDQERALQLLREGQRNQLLTLPSDHVRVAILDINIASILDELGRPDSALALYTSCTPKIEKGLGPDHPTLAFIHVNIGSILSAEARYAEAVREYRIGERIRIAALGAQHPTMMNIYNSIGKVFLRWDLPDSALFYYDKALAIVQANNDTMSADEALVRVNRALAFLDAGRSADAVGDAQRAMDIHVNVLNSPAGKLINVQTTLGLTHFASGDPALARKELEVVPMDSRNERALLCLAQIAIADGRDQEALENLIERAGIRKDHKGQDTRRDTEMNILLKKVATKLGRKDVLDEFDLQ